MLQMQDLDLDKMKFSKEKLCNKRNKVYKHFILYDNNNSNNSNDTNNNNNNNNNNKNNSNFFPLLIRFSKMIGCLKVFKDGKT